MANDTYLGDGLYASYDGYQIELYAFNGYHKTNQVYLEPGVLAALFRYVEELKREYAEARKQARQKEEDLHT